MSATAKLFKHGGSQAVRLPKAFRFEGHEVKISRSGNKVILEPVERVRFGEEFWARLDAHEGPPMDYLPDDPPLQPDPDLDWD